MSSSSSRNTTASSNQTVQETMNNVDNRATQGDGSIGGNVNLNLGTSATLSDVTISTTDQGAVKAGLDMALESLAGMQNVVKANASVASDSISQAYGLANAARQSETSGAINNALKYFALVAGLGILAWAYKRSRG